MGQVFYSDKLAQAFCLRLMTSDLDGVDGYGAEKVGEGELGSRDT
jgi:hypothetical protein